MLNFISIISFDSLKNAVKETVRLLQVVWRLSPFMWPWGKSLPSQASVSPGVKQA